MASLCWACWQDGKALRGDWRVGDAEGERRGEKLQGRAGEGETTKGRGGGGLCEERRKFRGGGGGEGQWVQGDSEMERREQTWVGEA